MQQNMIIWYNDYVEPNLSYQCNQVINIVIGNTFAYN